MERFFSGLVLGLFLGPLALPAPALEPPPVVLSFTGDLMSYETSLTAPRFDAIYEPLAPWLKTDDLSFANLEAPVIEGQVPSGYPRFNTTRAYVEAALRGGLEVFSLANNHANDFGPATADGTLASVEALAATHRLTWSGLNREPGQAPELRVLRPRGLRVGFVALTNLVNQSWGQSRVNYVLLWDVWTRQTYPETQASLVAQIREWKASVDLLVVSLHDGLEYTSAPREIQVNLYRRLVEAGVDVLWCHHPHVLLPWTWVSTDRGPRLVLYSMGNFVSRQSAALGPDEALDPRARTGDAALLQVGVFWDLARARYPHLEARPVLLNQYHDPVAGTVVFPTQTLAEAGPEAWRAYYTTRLARQQDWAQPWAEPARPNWTRREFFRTLWPVR